MDANEYAIEFHRTRILRRLIDLPQFPPALLTEDLLIYALGEILPGAIHDRLLSLQEYVDEEYGYGGKRKMKTTRRTHRRRDARLAGFMEELKEALDTILRNTCFETLLEAPFEQKSERIREIFELDPIEDKIVSLFGLCAVDTVTNDIIQDSELEYQRRNLPAFLARLLDLTPSEVRLRIGHGSRLRKKQVLNFDEIVANENLVVKLSDPVLKIFSDESVTAENITDSFYQKESGPELGEPDFDHMRNHLNRVREILQDAWRYNRKGTNILLFGTPGLGKTQLARLVGQQTEATTFAVPRRDDDGDTNSASDRRVAIDVYQRLCKGESHPVLIVDEAEGLLSECSFFGLRSRESNDMKAWLTEVLVENPLPVIWILNHHDDIHDAVKRRFTYSVRFPEFTPKLMTRVWRKTLAQAGKRFLLSRDEVERLVDVFDLSPGHVAQAVDTWKRTTHRRKAKLNDLHEILAQALWLTKGEEPSKAKLRAIDTRYDPALLNLEGEMDAGKLAGLVAKFYELRAAGARDAPEQLGLMFHGPSGTGKTELAKYVAKEAHKRLQVERMSDLLSKWVGESEQNIAAAFQRASQSEKILLLDEFDSLAYDRRNAVRSWEVSQTNEILQQIENFSGVLIVSTNLVDNLDPAISRRFAMKIEFQGIKPELRFEAVGKYFGDIVDWNGSEVAFRGRIERLRSLHPGDLRAVRQRYQTNIMLGEKPTAEQIVAALEHEATYRKGSGRTIGFKPDTLN